MSRRFEERRHSVPRSGALHAQPWLPMARAWILMGVPHHQLPVVTIAGQVVPDPFVRVARYAQLHEQTVTRYDLGPPGAAGRITVDEVARRVIKSRIGRKECEQLTAACEQSAGTLATIPPTAHLRDADPAVQRVQRAAKLSDVRLLDILA